MSDKVCPQCGKPTEELLHIDSDLKGKLTNDVGLKNVPESVCPDCYQKFGVKLSREANKKNKRAAKEQQRLNLWRSRVHLIREARDRFAVKDLSGAVVAYEKYFRVLELIYDVKPNEIKVTHFNNSARAKEIVVIASAYWDLMRIYDQSKRFANRMQQCAEKLGEFLPYTPIYAEMIRKIEDYKKTAKSKDKFELVLKTAGKAKRRCFIATAAFQDADAPSVVILATYRDDVLTKTTLGRAFTQTYYAVSPSLAKALDHSPFLQGATRAVLTPVANYLKEKYRLKVGHH